MSESSKLEGRKLHEFESLMELDFDSVVYFLGAKSVDEYTPPDISSSYDYHEIGLRLWVAIEHDLYGIICDRKKREPKRWINELIGGDIRQLATGIILAMQTNLQISVGIAVPAAALLIKRGVLIYCSEHPRIRSMGTVQEILAETKEMVESDIKDDLNSLRKYFANEQRPQGKRARSKKSTKKKD